MNCDEVVNWDQVKQGMQTRVLDDGPKTPDPVAVSRYFTMLSKRWESDPLFRAFVQQNYGNSATAIECLGELEEESDVMQEAFNQFVTYDDLAILAEEDNKSQRSKMLKRSFKEEEEGETAMDE